MKDQVIKIYDKTGYILLETRGTYNVFEELIWLIRKIDCKTYIKHLRS